MKNPIRLLCSVVFNLVIAAGLSGCSKEAGEGKNVNVSAMTEALKSEDKDIRINACVELANAGPRAAPAVQALIRLLKDDDAGVRRLAAYALGEIGPESKPALPALKELLNDPDRQVAMQAVNSLRSIDPKDFSGMKNITVSGPP